jgi:hypothetical protein
MHYNILSIDGGGMKSMIPAIIIDQMETYAHTYAASKWEVASTEKKVKGYPSGNSSSKIHMSELF